MLDILPLGDEIIVPSSDVELAGYGQHGPGGRGRERSSTRELIMSLAPAETDGFLPNVGFEFDAEGNMIDSSSSGAFQVAGDDMAAQQIDTDIAGQVQSEVVSTTMTCAPMLSKSLSQGHSDQPLAISC